MLESGTARRPRRSGYALLSRVSRIRVRWCSLPPKFTQEADVRDLLAERLLASVMKWTAEDVAEHRPDLQALAAFKYDKYQQYSPGLRFIESLALWLDQF